MRDELTPQICLHANSKFQRIGAHVRRRERRREHRVHALRGGVEPSRDVQKDSALPSRQPRLRDDVFLVRRMVSFSVRGFRLREVLPEKPVVAIRRRGIRARGDEPATLTLGVPLLASGFSRPVGRAE